MYDDAPKEGSSEMEISSRTPLLSERLQNKKVKLESELAQVERAIEKLKANPGVEQTIDALAKALGRL